MGGSIRACLGIIFEQFMIAMDEEGVGIVECFYHKNLH